MLNCALSAFGFYAGVRLWSSSPNAPWIARIYLVMLGLVGLAGLALPRLFGLSLEYLQFRLSLSSVVSAGVWLVYFSHSRRVKATYG
jgi:hypothetical protein